MNKLLHISRLAWAYKISHATVLSYPPYQFTIEATNACNLACDFCPQSDPEHKENRPPGMLTEENLALFLERVNESGTANRNINFTLDGEPFLNKKFVRFIEMASAAGFVSGFATNATLMNREIIDAMIEAGPFRASIDFASDSEIFEKVRGRQGHFERVYENLLYLVEKSRDHKSFRVDIHDISSFAGIDADRSLAGMRGLFPDNLPSRISLDSRQFHNFCGHLEINREDSRQYRLCPYPWTQMAITYDGDCVACCRDTAARSVLGNIFESKVMEIWNNERYREFRRNLIDRKPELNAACRNCDLPRRSDKARWRIGYMAKSLLGR